MTVCIFKRRHTHQLLSFHISTLSLLEIRVLLRLKLNRHVNMAPLAAIANSGLRLNGQPTLLALALTTMIVFGTKMSMPSHSMFPDPTIPANETTSLAGAAVEGNITTTPFDRPLTVLVTFSENEPFVSTMAKLNSTHRDPGGFDVFQGWKMDDVKAQWPEANHLWTLQGQSRPACMAVKSFIVSQAMKDFPEGSWIWWIDSSRHHPVPLQSDVGPVVDFLEQHGAVAYPGVPLCRLTNFDKIHVDPRVFTSLNLDIPTVWYAPHYQNAVFGFKNNALTRQFVAEWRAAMSDTDIACASFAHDQAPFSALVRKYDFPAVHVCTEDQQYRGPDPNTVKNPNFLFKNIVDRPYQKLYKADEILRMWRQFDWFKRPGQGVGTVID